MTKKTPLYISGMDYFLPDMRISAAELISRDGERVRELQGQFKFVKGFQEFTGFGIDTVPVSTRDSGLTLAVTAAKKALKSASVAPEQLDLIIDYTTVPYRSGPLGPVVQGELNAMGAQCLGLNSGGCASLQLAFQIASNYFGSDSSVNNALLFAGDCVPGNSRVCFPLSILGDGGSSVVISRKTGDLKLIATSVITNGKLHKTVGLPGVLDEPIPVDIPEFESRLLPVHYKACFDVITASLRIAELDKQDICHVIYPNMSVMDRDGFSRAFRDLGEKLVPGPLRSVGHIFASDMIINLCELLRSGSPDSGDYILMVSSGAGFYWSASILQMV